MLDHELSLAYILCHSGDILSVSPKVNLQLDAKVLIVLPLSIEVFWFV